MNGIKISLSTGTDSNLMILLDNLYIKINNNQSYLSHNIKNGK